MRRKNSEENWQMLKRFSLTNTRVTTDSMLGYEAAISQKSKRSACPDHIYTNTQRYSDFCEGYKAGIRRRTYLVSWISGTTVSGEIWSVKRKGHNIPIGRILDQARRNHVVGDVTVTYSDLATGERRQHTYGI